jgi:hypothetical protein
MVETPSIEGEGDRVGTQKQKVQRADPITLTLGAGAP